MKVKNLGIQKDLFAKKPKPGKTGTCWDPLIDFYVSPARPSSHAGVSVISSQKNRACHLPAPAKGWFLGDFMKLKTSKKQPFGGAGTCLHFTSTCCHVEWKSLTSPCQASPAEQHASQEIISHTIHKVL